MANYRHGATYGSLAYDLDALAREKQLDEAGKLPQKKVRPTQPEVQPVQRRQSAARAPGGPAPGGRRGTGGGGGLGLARHGHRADAVLCEADRHFR